MIFLSKLYAKYDWSMQYHINAARNNNSKMLNLIGPDTGFDSINDSNLSYANFRGAKIDNFSSRNNLIEKVFINE